MEAIYFRSFYHFEPEIRSGDHADLLAQLNSDLQSGIVIHADSPDFRVKARNKTIGVEIRRLFTSIQGPALESAQDGILEEACRIAEHSGLPSVHVALFFNLRGPLRVADRHRIANAVVQVVADNMPADGGLKELDHRPGQPAEVDLILINRHSPGQRRWRVGAEFSPIGRNAFHVLQTAINEKAARLPTYLQACDECWLLLVADSFRASGKLKLDDDRHDDRFFSSFTRTYALDFGHGHLHRLETLEAEPPTRR